MKGLFFKIFSFLALFIWAFLIFYLSSQHSIVIGLSAPLEIFFRKWVHVLVFGILALLFFAFLKSFNLNTNKSFIFSLIFSFIYAVSDEFHQSFVLGRYGNYRDVLIDLSGITLFLISLDLFLISKKLCKKKVFLFLSIFIFTLYLILSLVGVSRHVESVGIEGVEGLDVLIQNESIREEDDRVIFSDEGPDKEEFVFKDAVLWDVPFVSQAPFGVWDDYHEEACEEASLAMFSAFYTGKVLNNESMEKELLAMRDFQLKNNRHFLDSSMDELASLAKDFYGLDLDVISDFSIEDLKSLLMDGHILIIPTAGKELKNPYFKNGGPWYHNLVLIGYDNNKNTFSVNDPGTYRGEKFEYDQELLFDSIHDFTGKKRDIKNGKRKALLIVK